MPPTISGDAKIDRLARQLSDPHWSTGIDSETVLRLHRNLANAERRAERDYDPEKLGRQSGERRGHLGMFRDRIDMNLLPAHVESRARRVLELVAEGPLAQSRLSRWVNRPGKVGGSNL